MCGSAISFSICVTYFDGKLNWVIAMWCELSDCHSVIWYRRKILKIEHFKVNLSVSTFYWTSSQFFEKFFKINFFLSPRLANRFKKAIHLNTTRVKPPEMTSQFQNNPKIEHKQTLTQWTSHWQTICRGEENSLKVDLHNKRRPKPA